MALAKCVRCDKMFNKLSSPVCVDCQKEEDADFERIRDVLAENPDLNAEGVAELSGVDMECVLRMLDQGLISNISLGEAVKCGRCGAPAISVTKRLCQSCLEKLNREMANAQKSIKMGQKKKTEVGEYGGGSAHSHLEDKRR